ncbi:MAG: helix-turn-helix domain-containing protein [Bacteroidota bacterium]
MTEKKESIINAALELFAKEGFKATSTSKVAKAAGVSEGLIFRHFENKEGLLDAILKEGEERVKVLFADIVLETNPKEVLRKALNLGIKMNEKEADAHFWRLQYKIKWELEYFNEQKMEPLERALEAAFSKLNIEDPILEARLFLISLEGMATRFYLQQGFDMNEMLNFMKKKYVL